MQRIAVIGNIAGGKSLYARCLADRRSLPYFELDRYIFDGSFRFMPDADAQHMVLIQQDRWVIDGLEQPAMIARRLDRATAIVLVDLPVWMHYAIAAERQTAWAMGTLEHPPGGHRTPRPTAALFRDIWRIDREVLPQIRASCAKAEEDGKPVTRITSWEDLKAVKFAEQSRAAPLQ
jgi:adenylate kinase family enzyme